MVIQSVDIHRFGRLSGFKTELDPAFNLIEGDNESGKSTLAAFILYMLYGFDDSTEERRLRTPWDGNEISGSMTVESDGVSYRIDRESLLREDGKRDSYRLTRLDTGLTETGGISPGERFLGVSREVFVNTALFSADTILHADGDALTRAIENIIFSLDERTSVTEALRTLDMAGRGVLTPDGKSGMLLSLEKRREELGERLRAAHVSEKKRMELENELFRTEKKRADCQARLADAHRKETDYANALIIRDYDRLHELEDSCAERERVIREFEGRHREGGFLPDASYMTELTLAKADMQAADEKKKRTSDTLAQTRADGMGVDAKTLALLARLRDAGTEEELHLKSSAKRAAKTKSLVLFVLFFSLAAAGGILSIFAYTLFGSIALVITLAVMLALCGMGVVTLVEFLRENRALKEYYALADAVDADGFAMALMRAADAEHRRDEYEARLARETQDAEQAEREWDGAKEKLSRALCRWHADLCLDENYEATVTALCKEVAEFVTQEARLLGERDRADKEVHELRIRLEGLNEIAVRALVSPKDRERLCAENAANLRHAVEHYERMLHSLVEKEDDLRARLAQSEQMESSAAVVEEIIATERRMRELKEYASLCYSAKEKLQGSLERLRTEVSPRLSLYACGMIDSLTEGKYTDLEIGDDFSLSVLAEGEPREIAYLSHGTKELAYFSLRIALLDLLYRTGVPICLDETLAHQDDDRAMAFMQALRGVCAEGKQCFLFSCHTREKEMADSVFASYKKIYVE